MRTTTQTGSSLVEVMVALFVLAIGLLGILAMQSKSMQYNQSAHVYSQAIYLANDIAERIRNNPTVAADYVIAEDASATAGTDCGSNPCAPGALVDWDIREWKALVSKVLPAGRASLEPITDGIRVEVSFDDSRSEGSQTETRKTYALVVGI
ncbi:MAG: type IV pilus modification protein PilV [Cellvibrionaceae bacterium]|nr:type IV pilus modification protein PilV [Cellvibrionaceae bacterium]